MSDIFDKFDNSFDIEGLQDDLKEVEENGVGDFKETPHGTYEVEINKMELKATKDNRPMVSIWFKVCEGDYKNGLIFYSQLINSGFGIHNSNNFLKSLDSSIDIEFSSFKQYGQMIEDIFKEVDGTTHYQLEYKSAKNPKFSTFEIKDIYDL